MALGDGDLRIFFRDGDTLSFGGVSTYPDGEPVRGNVEERGKDADFGGGAAVSDSQYFVELPWNAFSPFPTVGSHFNILTGRLAGSYKVRSVDPVEDGQTQQIGLRTQ